MVVIALIVLAGLLHCFSNAPVNDGCLQYTLEQDELGVLFVELCRRRVDGGGCYEIRIEKCINVGLIRHWAERGGSKQFGQGVS
jgi:hypothetical protein